MIDPRYPDYSRTPVATGRPSFSYRPDDFSEPPISVVTPFFNTGEVFHETARSVLQQSLQQFEWIIVNDGSTRPESLAILDGYRARDPRVRVIDHDRNRGLGAARNTGFKHAATPYVLSLDSDDLIEPTTAEKWLWFLESHPEAAFVGSWSVGFEGHNYLWQRGFDEGPAFLRANNVAQTALIRRRTHIGVGGYDEALPPAFEDWDFWLKCADNGYWGWTIDEFLFWYRRAAPDHDRWGIQEKTRAFRRELRTRYPKLSRGGFPSHELRFGVPERIPDGFDWANLLDKKTKRVLFIIPYLVLGGAEKFDIDLMEGLAARGWEITVASTLANEDPWLPEFARITPDVFRLHSFLATKDYPRFLSYLIDSRRPDVVFLTNSELGYKLLPYLAAKHPQLPVVDLCHAEQEDWRNGGYPRDAIDYKDLIDTTIVTSAYLKRWMIDRGGSDRIEVVYTGADVERWAPIAAVKSRVRDEYAIDSKTPVILYAGRLCPQKQPRVFAQVMAELDRRGLNYVSWVAGDGEDGPWLRRFVTRNRLAHKVFFHGSVPIARMRELMIAADIFFLPSDWEGIALTLYEAMSTECAVVGSDVRGQSELVTPESGVLVPGADSKRQVVMFADALAHLIEDHAERQRLARAARRRVAQGFTIESMRDQVATHLERARDVRASRNTPSPNSSLASAHALLALREADFARRYTDPRLRRAAQPTTAERLYQAAIAAGAPFYRLAMRRNWRWAPRLNDAVKQRISSRLP